MAPLTHNFRIHRIRLINFHNFTNETIPIENGGHLFLLGDNGSGKTTVLDAVHYVLTAGQSMEFNSAARAAGSRKDSGRRAQGVVMRYNINAEPTTMNPSGGVSYAAIELKDNHNKSLVLAIGLSCSSMDETIHRWGIIRSGTLEEVPFILTELNGQRPRNRREMKASLENKGFYGQIGSYRRDLATRLYGNETTYNEVCKFLSTSKAYREIASNTDDYHLLFRKLLQEPDPEVFEKVIRHLKSLEDSRQDLDRMQSRLDFLTELTTLHGCVETLRTRQASLRWLTHDLKHKQHLDEHSHLIEKTEAEKSRLQNLAAQNSKNKLTLEELNHRIYELGNQDKDGLVPLQRQLEHDVKRTSSDLEQLQLDWKNLNNALDTKTNEYGKRRKQLLKSIQNHFTTIHRAAKDLPVSVQPILNQLDSATSNEHPELQLQNLDTKNTALAVDEYLMLAQAEKQNQQSQCQTLSNELQALEKQLDTQRKQSEAQPLIEKFTEAKQQLSEKMFTAQPLYSGLEPREGITRKELATLEQLIGEEILGTWVVPPNEEHAVRRLLFTRFPSQTLAVVEPDASDPLPDWIRHWFDPSRSDPYALIALQREMTSSKGPTTQKFDEFETLSFRARQQKLHGNPVRLLGVEMRRKQLAQEIILLEGKIKVQRAEKKQADAVFQKTIQRIQKFSILKETLDCSELRSEANQTALVFHQTEPLRVQTESAYESVNRIEEDLAMASGKLADIRLQIESKGLHDLESRIAGLKKEHDRKDRTLGKDTKEEGKLEGEIRRAQAFASNLVTVMHEELVQQNEAEEALHRYGGFEEVSLFVAEQIERANYATAEQAQAEREELRIETTEKETELKGMAAGHEGQTFSFVYDKEHNRLSDRRSRSADQVLEELSRNYREQQEIISEETRRLFEQFVMQDLLTALRDRVTHLMDMSQRIGKVLKEREFGNNRYTFRAKPLDPFKRIYNLIRSYSELAAEDPARELQEFIEEHQEQIINTAPGDMPELLDYRNWFHFDLQVKTGSSETTMDRKTKSIGSGGEQAVPNYLIILTIAHFLYDVPSVKLPLLLFDEAFYGIDAQRRDQLLAFASDLNLQLFVASPDQDGVKKEIPYSTSLFVIKDKNHNIHLHDFHWKNPKAGIQQDLLQPETTAPQKITFGEELES